MVSQLFLHFEAYPSFVSKNNDGFAVVNFDHLYQSLPDSTYIVSIGMAGANHKKGLVDRDGTELIPCKYLNLQPLGNNLFKVQSFNLYKLDKWGIINKTGDQILSFDYDAIGDVSGNLIWVKQYNKFSVIDVLGQQRLIPHAFQDVRPWGQDKAGVKVDGRWMFIDIQGNQIGTDTYDDAGTFSNDRALVSVGGMWGYIDPQGKLVIPCNFAAGKDFDMNGHAWVMENGKWGIIDQSGKYIRPAVIDSAKWIAKDRVAVLVNGNWGLLDDKYNVIFPPRSGYPFIDNYDALGLARVIIDPGQLNGFINRDGVLVVETPGEDIANFHAAK